MPFRTAPPAASRPLRDVRPMLRTTYARVVHEAVCQFTDSDGFGRCDLYAIGGFSLAMGEKLAPLPHLQAGSLLIQPDPGKPDRWFAFDASDGGFGRGECHAWLMAEDGTIIDLAARHYRRYAESLPIHDGVLSRTMDGSLITLDRPEARTPWTRTDHLEYLWTTADKMPSWVRFRTDHGASTDFTGYFRETFHGAEMTRFRSLLWRTLGRMKPR